MEQAIKKQIKEEYSISTEKKIYTLLLDMNSIMKMSLSADRRVGNNGLEYGMVFQTLLQIKLMLNKKDFDYVYAFYDGNNSGVLRYEIYKDYKANRDKNYTQKNSDKSDYDAFLDNYAKKVISYSYDKRKCLKTHQNESDDESFDRQRDLLFKILEELFIRQEIKDDVEGDDLIAYYIKNKKPNEKIVIFSSDRDLTQLISDDITVYIPKLKKFITPKNDVELIGFPSYNILLKKILCGDSSDNIKGIKGLGEGTLVKEFPKILTEKMDIEEIIEESKIKNEERIKNKKKPLQSLLNIINKETDGCQGKEIFEINKKIIDLNEPLLTDEAIKELESMMYAPLSPNGRDFKNVYSIIVNNGMSDLIEERKFSSFFSSFNPIKNKEIKRFKENN